MHFYPHSRQFITQQQVNAVYHHCIKNLTNRQPASKRFIHTQHWINSLVDRLTARRRLYDTLRNVHAVKVSENKCIPIYIKKKHNYYFNAKVFRLIFFPDFLHTHSECRVLFSERIHFNERLTNNL